MKGQVDVKKKQKKAGRNTSPNIHDQTEPTVTIFSPQAALHSNFLMGR